MKKFLEDLEKELKKNNISKEEIDEIIKDHEEMIEAAIKEGLDEAQLDSKFGDPVRLAKEIAEDKTETDRKEDETKDKQEETTKDNWQFDLTEEKFEVDISLVSEDLVLKKANVDKLEVRYFGKGKDSRYNVEFTDNKLIISVKKRMGFFNFNISGNNSFEIKVPENKKISFCSIKQVSGDLQVSDFEIEDLAVKTTSGDGMVKNVETKDFRIESVSGDFTVNDVDAEDCFVSLVSGDLDIKEFHVKENIKINSVSGDVKIHNSDCIDLDFKTVSGDLDGQEFYPQSVGLKSVSGDIKIKNQNSDKQIHVRYQKTMSGDVKIISK